MQHEEAKLGLQRAPFNTQTSKIMFHPLQSNHMIAVSVGHFEQALELTVDAFDNNRSQISL